MRRHNNSIYVSDVVIGDFIFFAIPRAYLQVKDITLSTTKKSNVDLITLHYEGGSQTKRKHITVYRMAPIREKDPEELPKGIKYFPVVPKNALELFLKLDHYTRGLERYKHGSNICDCGCIVPCNKFCPDCLKYSRNHCDSHIYIPKLSTVTIVNEDTIK